MGLMDKFKDLFTDEEVVEDDDEKVEIKEIKKEEPAQLPTFMREKIEKEKEDVPQIKQLDSDVEVKKEIKLEPMLDDDNSSFPSSEKQKFKFPIDLNDNDFVETRSSRQSMRARELEDNIVRDSSEYSFKREEEAFSKKVDSKVSKVRDLYKDKKEEEKDDVKVFRATPIISPIYGVMDKNYDPNEVTSRGNNLEHSRPSKSVDFDSVRKKAYGNLSREIKENLMCENCEYLKEAKECGKHDSQNTESCEYEYVDENDITLDEAAENYYDYGVPYEKNNVDVENDAYYLDDNQDVRISDYTDSDEDTRKKDIPPVKSSINLLSTLKKSMGDEEEGSQNQDGKNLELTDDLFNLIDSMYDERNEGK